MCEHRKINFQLVEDLLQQNPTFKSVGKGYYWGTFFGFMFSPKACFTLF